MNQSTREAIEEVVSLKPDFTNPEEYARKVRELTERVLADLAPRKTDAGVEPDESENLPPWRCFHCGEVFTTVGGAADHFGSHQFAEPGCLIDQVALEEGGKTERGRGLLMALRKMETDRDEWMARALRAEDVEEGLEGVLADLRRHFGTTSPHEIHDRYDNERFRAKHAMKILDAAGIAFDLTDEQIAALRAPGVQDAEDAERWRALISSPRIRYIGGARLGEPDELLGIEFYGEFPDPEERQFGRERLIDFVERRVAAGALKEGA